MQKNSHLNLFDEKLSVLGTDEAELYSVLTEFRAGTVQMDLRPEDLEVYSLIGSSDQWFQAVHTNAWMATTNNLKFQLVDQFIDRPVLELTEIPNVIVFPGMAAGFVLSVLQGETLKSLIALGIIFGITFLVFSFLHGLIGMGDMKLWMMAGSFLGFGASFIAFTAAQLLLALYVIITGRGREAEWGLRRVVLHRLRPEKTESYSFGIFFFIGCAAAAVLLSKGVIV